MRHDISNTNAIRFGLCCQFAEEPIAFRTTTATSLLRLSHAERLEKLSRLCLENAEALLRALRYCLQNGIGCFRVGSDILPVKTHPQAGYNVAQLPGAKEIVAAFRRCGAFARANRIRTVFHPDQFVVLNSPRPAVVASAIADLKYHAEVAKWINVDVIIIHGGGAYGDKSDALYRLSQRLKRLPGGVRSRIAIENDDKVFTPADLAPVCRGAGVPMVYDVHHHRCLPDGWSVSRATAEAFGTWRREPLFHISSPREGWRGPRPQCHHDYIDWADFPDCWRPLAITVEVEAKAKELAVLRLMNDLRNRVSSRRGGSRRPASHKLEKEFKA